MDLRDLLSVLRSRWIVIVAATLIGGLLALGMSLLTPPSYQAKVQFYVTVAGGDSAAAAYQGSLGAQQRVQSYAALVKSTDITQQVVDTAGVDLAPAKLADQTTATADAKTVLLNVAVTNSDPQRALQLAEGFGEVLPEAINRLETPDGGGPALAKLTVVNPPALPTSPVAPKTEQNVAIGLVLGLLAGVGIALLINTLDRRVKSAEQVESIAGKPVVGSIPFRKAEDKERGAEHIVPFREGHSPAAESFRRLRTNLQFLNVDNPPRVFVLTSSVATEGKSETAINLSIALAESGNRVLLIEADLRRPLVVSYMSMPDKVGLTNILSGQAEFGDVVQETRHDGVHLLACGPLPPNPSELLASEMARHLIDELRSTYDYVIIDSPPLLPVTDGALLARITDGALLVVRSHRTTADQVAQAVDNLAKADAALLGIVTVANKPAKKGSAGYYDSYYYSSKTVSAAGEG
ncbi:receptor protein-tyrosine kinase [Dietzia kunjamensis]|uniref:polysaccharide biosynthesis tyrosine autokinase n=1 Tax=Dietzia kunjamensis TaxID=322509 RepID=UPI000E728735|nr:polysaccharide biosynthesis tyrosine autokinase [Dietzia kunjamensis]MBB1012565.1 polysaccharide biosynthesis tyrosine autokinase [Dietzia kunjamensis]RKE59510.1 receptor protein-tyrosine kinase [Dietzia kunjamensis]